MQYMSYTPCCAVRAQYEQLQSNHRRSPCTGKRKKNRSIVKTGGKGRLSLHTGDRSYVASEYDNPRRKDSVQSRKSSGIAVKSPLWRSRNFAENNAQHRTCPHQLKTGTWAARPRWHHLVVTETLAHV